jgi:hypothetical protein
MIRLSLRKGLLLLSLSFLSILIVTILFLWWFITTGRDVIYFERLLEEKTGLDISIGELDLGKEGFMFRDLKAYRKDDGLRIVIPSVLITGGFSAIRGGRPLIVKVLAPSVTVSSYFIRDKLQEERDRRSNGYLIPLNLVVSDGSIVVTGKDDERLGISDVNVLINTSRESAVKGEGSFRVEGYGGYGKFSLDYDSRRPEAGRAGFIISGVRLKNFPAGEDLMISGNLTLRLLVSGMSQGEAGLKIEDLALQKAGGTRLMEGGFLDLQASLRHEDSLKGVSVVGKVSLSEGGRDGSLRFEGVYDIKKDSFGVSSGEIQLDDKRIFSFRGSLDRLKEGSPEISAKVSVEEWSLKDLLEFSGLRALSEGGISVDGRIAGRVDMRGPLKSPVIEGKLFFKETDVVFRDLDLRGLNISIPFIWETGAGMLRGRGLSLSSGEFVKAGGDVNLSLKEVMTGYARLRVMLSPKSGPLRDLLNKTLPGYSIDGMINLSPRIEFKSIPPPAYSASVKGSVLIKKGMFSSPDGEIVAEGIGGEGRYNLEWEQGRGLNGDVTLGIKRGEVLAGVFYSDVAASPVSLGIVGGLGKDGNLRVDESFISIEGLGRVAFSGELERGVGEKKIIDGISLFSLQAEGLFDILKDALGSRHPFLKKTGMRGNISGEFRLRGLVTGPFISGRLTLKALDILNREAGLEVKNLNLHLPLAFGGKDESALNQGNLTFDKAGLGDIILRNGNFPLEVKGGDIFISENINLPVFGGDLIGKDLYIRDYAGEERLVHASLEFRGLDLEEITRELKIHQMKGRLSGKIPDLVLLGDDLYSDGTVTVSVFGGTVVMENLALKGLFGPVPSFEADISLKDIDLARMTETFDIGRISGILSGYVRNLKVVEGEPERFDLFLETRKRPGVSQKISVKALKKIQILGSGGTMGILDRGIYRFFKEYRYEKIGMRARLRNDILSLRGIEGERGREYLVRGGLFPPKVDVISYTQEIPFKELLRRLERIKKVE